MRGELEIALHTFGGRRKEDEWAGKSSPFPASSSWLSAGKGRRIEKEEDGRKLDLRGRGEGGYWARLLGVAAGTVAGANMVKGWEGLDFIRARCTVYCTFSCSLVRNLLWPFLLPREERFLRPLLVGLSSPLFCRDCSSSLPLLFTLGQEGANMTSSGLGEALLNLSPSLPPFLSGALCSNDSHSSVRTQGLRDVGHPIPSLPPPPRPRHDDGRTPLCMCCLLLHV